MILLGILILGCLNSDFEPFPVVCCDIHLENVYFSRVWLVYFTVVNTLSMEGGQLSQIEVNYMEA